jgi:hypothetical protein
VGKIKHVFDLLFVGTESQSYSVYSVCMPLIAMKCWSITPITVVQSPPGVEISSPEVLPPSIFSFEESKNKETTSNDLSAKPRRSLSAPRDIFGLAPLDHQAQGGTDGFFPVAPGSDPSNIHMARARRLLRPRPLRPLPRGRVALAAFYEDTTLSSPPLAELVTAERLAGLPSFRCIDDMSDADKIDSPIQLAMKPVDPHLDILLDVTCSTTRRTTTVTPFMSPAPSMLQLPDGMMSPSISNENISAAPSKILPCFPKLGATRDERWVPMSNDLLFVRSVLLGF